MRNKLLTPTVASVALTGLLGAALLAPPATAAPPEIPGRDLAKKVTGERVWDHLEAFQEIADENGGNRAMGTPGYEASGAYVESVLQKAGYETERQYFEVEQFSVLDLTVEVPGVELEPRPMSYSTSTPDDGVTGMLVEPSVVTGCAAGDWGGIDATGMIALVSRGGCTFAAKSLNAAAAGAEAVIIYNNAAGALNGTLGGPDANFAPTVGVTQAEGDLILQAWEANPDLEVLFDLQTSLETKETFNVLAETRTGRDDNVVMLGAHLDSVDEGAGINDNGSGSAAILETAVQLSKGGPLNNKVRFAWWGAEELGLLGSWHYIEDLYVNSPEELEDISAYLNFDMIGSPNYTIGVYDANESTFEAPVTVPDGSVAVESIFTDYFDGIDQPWVDSPFSGRSDYQAFIEVGIPASGLFTGADGVKTEEEVDMFGGTAGILLDPNYHTPADDIDNVSMEALDIMSRAIGHAAQQLAWSTEDVNGEVGGGPGNAPEPPGKGLRR
ncbi:M20/M25/M40 family metallo-hydrolase [Isoptericola sp. b515]|uniref:M20/M25/M40 family metallo-hydrolase n=1 Tax=Isoptericola sp. b515 TaxID=3064652 RepID=UPI0027142654|nr:M20/M25/M40 family metallo-hydrolase [Isoptericola sp. b515]MDO8147840.1 M20/M25/M40 family metallo-hydrolase [Isoptericola sp. b515]